MAHYSGYQGATQVKIILCYIVTIWILSSAAHSDTIDYVVRSAKYNDAFDKLNLDIEVGLVGGKLPSPHHLRSITNDYLRTHRSAKRRWVFFFLPGMISGYGSFATDHCADLSCDGVAISLYMLCQTEYEGLAASTCAGY